MIFCFSVEYMQSADQTYAPLTEVDVTRFIGIHAVSIAPIDVGPYSHWGVCEKMSPG